MCDLALYRMASIAMTAVFAASGGCRPAFKGPRPTHEAAVVVTYEGGPVEQAMVIFSPLDSGYACRALTGPDGRAVLTSFQEGDGAVAGRYRVLIATERWMPNPAFQLPDREQGVEAIEQAARELLARGISEVVRGPGLPEKYSRYETSGLEAEVKPGETNTFVFDLSNNR